MRSTDNAAGTIVGRVAWRHTLHAGFVLARANSPVSRRWGGDALSLPYAALLSVFVVLCRDQTRTAIHPGRPGRAVLLVTSPGGPPLGPSAVVIFAVLAAGTCLGTLAALVLLPTVIVAGALSLLVTLVLLELVPAAALAWRTRALAHADREVRLAHPEAAQLHWVAAYPRGHDLGTDLLAVTVAQEGAHQPLRLSTRTQRLARWYARHGFETVATVSPPRRTALDQQGAAMVRPPGVTGTERIADARRQA